MTTLLVFALFVILCIIWYDVHIPRCPKCGTRMIRDADWKRRTCPRCGEVERDI